MKLKYIIFTLLIIGFGSLVAYRITQNKAQNQGGAAGAGGGRGAGGGGGAGGARPGGGGAGSGGSGGGPATQVNGIVVEARDFPNSILVSGSIEANEQVQIRSEISGLVRGIFFAEGGNVSRGQVLLKIDDSELQAQLAQATTRQQLAQENANRADLLLKKEAISKEEFDVSVADLRSLQSQTQIIRAQLAKTQVRAPFSGKIGLRSISNGVYITPSTAVANLVSMNPVKITFSIPEKYSGQVKTNTRFTFTVAGSNKTYSAVVFAIEPGIDATTRTMQLKARADNPKGELLPGLFAKIDLPLSTLHNAILVPSEAIIPVLKGKKVLVSENGKVKEVMVETGTRTDKDILITSGLKVGDTVLTTGTMSLKPDAAVKTKIVKN